MQINLLDVDIGKKIRHRRWFLGMSQKDLASAVGVRFQQIQKYETGTNRVSASRLWLISKALSLPITFFYEDADLVLNQSRTSSTSKQSLNVDQSNPTES